MIEDGVFMINKIVFDKIIAKEPISISEARLTVSNLKEKCPLEFEDYKNDSRIFKILQLEESK